MRKDQKATTTSSLQSRTVYVSIKEFGQCGRNWKNKQLLQILFEELSKVQILLGGYDVDCVIKFVFLVSLNSAADISSKDHGH